MRYLLSVLFLACMSGVYSKTIVLERDIRWFNNHSLFFENSISSDSCDQIYFFNELIDLPYLVDLQIEYLSWDTVPNNGRVNDHGCFNEFSNNLMIQNKHSNFRYKFLLNTIKIGKDTSKIIRLKNYRVYFYNTTLKKASYSNKSVLATGKWHKIKVVKNGLYKLSYSQIKKMGFENPANVSLFGYAMGMLPNSTIEPSVDDLLKIPVTADANNIYFFGSDAVDWKYNNSQQVFEHQYNKFSDTTYYFLTDAFGPPSIVESKNYTSENAIEIFDFDDYAFHEKEEYNLIRSGSEWFGNRMNNRQQTLINFTFPNLDVSTPLKIYYGFLNKAKSKGNFLVSINSNQQNIVVQSQYISSDMSGGYKSGYFNLASNSNNVKLSVEYQNNGDGSAEGFINYIGVNVKRKLIYNGEPLIFRNVLSISSVKELKYIIENVPVDAQIWDITDRNKPFKVEYSRNGQNVSFFSKSGELNTYILFSLSSGLSEPIIDDLSNTALKNQNIHGAEVPDLIIVAPDSSAIYDQANRLAKFRENNDGLKVLLVKISEVYNEFSAGRRDVTAIRNMVNYFYYQGLLGGKRLSYLLLFGDGTFANKTDFNGNNNLLPTYESKESIYGDYSYVTDDYFGWTTYSDIEAGNLLSIGVGRLPVKSYLEAADMVNKIIEYSNPSIDDDWRNIISFIADDEDGNAHLSQSDRLAQDLRKRYPYFDIRKIYLDAYVQTKTSSGEAYPGAVDAINDRINSGALIVNYTGHGSERQLAHENIINIKGIRKWNNRNKLPMFITATCEFSRWDDLNFTEKKAFTSAGEEVLLNPNGGAIAMLSTTRLVYSGPNFELNKAFYKYAFEEDTSGNYYRLGDLFRLTKNDPVPVSSGINRINFTLLGDPSMLLACPKKIFIKTDSINAVKLIDTIAFTDTIKALSVTRVSGHFESVDQIYPYNGIISVKVLDKPDTITTLANDKGSPKYRFVRQEATIFKGLVNVSDGKFSFEFPVPIDIKLNVAAGKIIYYAPSSDGSYGGFSDKILIGGVAGNNRNSFIGPEINLYMNDTNFQDGGITSPHPILLVKLLDDDGINSSGIGIGHDISAVLDNDYSKMYSLNANYRTELNDFRRGSATYSFFDLSPGEHNVKVLAWDIFNNSFEKQLNFRVIDNVDVEVSRIKNYPNPMKDYTYFTIEHNKPNEIIDIQIHIYSFTGALVNILKAEGFASGFRTAPLFWNGMDASGHKAGTGVYPYKLILKGKNGSSAQATGKLVIIK